MRHTRLFWTGVAALSAAALLAGCGGATGADTSTPIPSLAAAGTTVASAAPTVAAAATAVAPTVGAALTALAPTVVAAATSAAQVAPTVAVAAATSAAQAAPTVAAAAATALSQSSLPPATAASMNTLLTHLTAAAFAAQVGDMATAQSEYKQVDSTWTAISSDLKASSLPLYNALNDAIKQADDVMNSGTVDQGKATAALTKLLAALSTALTTPAK